MPSRVTKPARLYHASYGRIGTMINAITSDAGAANRQLDARSVPELVPDEVARASRRKLDAAYLQSRRAASASTIGQRGEIRQH